MRLLASATILAISAMTFAIIVPHTWKTDSSAKPDYYKASARYAKFEGRSAVIDFANASLASQAKRAINSFKKDITGMEKPRAEWFFEMKNVVTTATPNLISTRSEVFWYTGGAHPNRDYTTQNFGLVNGKPQWIGLAQLLNKGVKPSLIDDLIISKLKAAGASEAVSNQIPYLSPPQRDRFTISSAGLTWVFPPYDVGAYVEGEFFVELTWNELNGLVNMNGIVRQAMLR